MLLNFVAGRRRQTLVVVVVVDQFKDDVVVRVAHSVAFDSPASMWHRRIAFYFLQTPVLHIMFQNVGQLINYLHQKGYAFASACWSVGLSVC